MNVNRLIVIAIIGTAVSMFVAIGAFTYLIEALISTLK